MEPILEVLLEGLLQLIIEVIVGLVDFILINLLGKKLADRVKIIIHSLLLCFFGWLGAKISVRILPTVIGGSEPDILVSCLVLPSIVASILFFLIRSIGKLDRIKEEVTLTRFLDTRPYIQS